MKSLAVLLAIAAAVIGGVIYFAGRSGDQVTQDVLTLPDSASAAVARTNLSAALPAMQAFAAEHGGYAGATIDDLRRFDASVAGTVSLHDVSTAGYCLQSTVRTATASVTGPGGSIVDSPCP
jgi:hypothetical protein